MGVSNFGKSVGRILFGGISFLVSGTYKLVSFCFRFGKNQNFVVKIRNYMLMNQYSQALKSLCAEFQSPEDEANLLALARDVKDFPELYARGVSPKLALNKLVESIIFDEGTLEYRNRLLMVNFNSSRDAMPGTLEDIKLKTECEKFHKFLEEVKSADSSRKVAATRRSKDSVHYSLGLDEVYEAFMRDLDPHSLVNNRDYEQKIDLCFKHLSHAREVLVRYSDYSDYSDLLVLVEALLDALKNAKLPTYRARFIRILNEFYPYVRDPAYKLLK